MGEYNTGVDTNKMSDANFNEQYLKDHGLVGYYWTYGTQQDYEKAFLLGLVRLVFDEADTIAKIIKYITANDFITNEENKTNVPLVVTISVSSVFLLGLAIFFIIKFIKK